MEEAGLDRMLSALAGGTAHPGLEGIEERVAQGIVRDAQRRAALRGTWAAGIGALAIGLASTSLIPAETSAAPLDPLADSAALAPSALLLGPQR